MLNDFKCKNTKCKHNNKLIKDILHKSNENPKCAVCDREMIKVWSGGVAIRTGDGSK